MDIVLLICILSCCFLFMIVGNNCVGGINEDLEIIKPKMRKAKLPKKLKYFIPQWCKIGGRDPEGAISKSEVYFLTLFLAVFNYTFHVLCFIGTIIVYYMLTPSDVVWVMLPIGCFFVVDTVIGLIVDFKKNKIEEKNQGRLDKDFTITKEAENDKSDEMPESMTDNQDKRD